MVCDIVFGLAVLNILKDCSVCLQGQAACNC